MRGYKTIVIMCIIFVVIIICFLFLSVVSFGGVNFLLPMEKPEITYGQFDFKLEYEVAGEIKIIRDTLVCEFDGFKTLGEAGKYRKWNIWVQSTGQKMIKLYDLREKHEFTNWGNQVLELCFDPGNGEYYMGDIGDRQRGGSMGKYIDYLYETPEGELGYSAFGIDEAWEKYHIRIISWECSPPIKNSFK